MKSARKKNNYSRKFAVIVVKVTSRSKYCCELIVYSGNKRSIYYATINYSGTSPNGHSL